MRPTTILSLLAGLLVAIVAVLTAITLFVDRTGGNLWFFWIAPLLVLGLRADDAQPAPAVLGEGRRLEVEGSPARVT